MQSNIKIKALKYKDISHYEWDTTLIAKNEKYLLVKAEINRKLTHHTKGKVFTFDRPAIEFFPFEEWFTVSVEKTVDNQLRYYCNIAMPAVYRNNECSFVDLDLDIIKDPDGDWTLVDEDEFITNSKKFKYPQQLIDKTIAEEKKLRERIYKSIFPFDGWIENLALNLDN